jgi:hypothetical protein
VNWCRDLLSLAVIRLVHLETDIRRRSEVLAGGMNRGAATKASNILRDQFGRECTWSFIQAAKYLFKVETWIKPNDMFRKWGVLDQEEPPHVFRGELLIGFAIGPY